MGNRRALAAAVAAGLLAIAGAEAGELNSRILDSPSRDVIRRNEPALRSIEPRGNLTRSRGLSGMIGGLGARGDLPRGAGDDGSTRHYSMDCVLHHERLERTARQPFASDCNPSVDRGAGFPAYTPR